MIEIRRCPFCGSEAILAGGNAVTVRESDSNGAYIGTDIDTTPTWVECEVCHATGPDFNNDKDDRENAVRAWNKRTLDMDKTAVFLRIRALTHALDMTFSNEDEALSEDADTISAMLVELVDEYDRMRKGDTR